MPIYARHIGKDQDKQDRANRHITAIKDRANRHRQGQQTYNGNQGQGQQINNGNQGQVQNGNQQAWNNMYNQQVINRLQENGNVSIDHEDREHKLLLKVGHINAEEIESINQSLKDMGLTLNDPNVWIADTGATTHTTAYANNSINHCEATEQDDMAGFTGVLAKAKTIIDILCEMKRNGKLEKFVLTDVTYVPNSCYNLFSLTKLISNGWFMSSDMSSRIKICKGKHKIKFTTTVHMLKGVLYVAVFNWRKMGTQQHEVTNQMHAKVVNGNEYRMECAMVAKPITINRAHCMCSHMGQVEAHEICEIYGQEIAKSGFKQCQHCGKPRQNSCQ
jgi:hypothetical protein